MRVNVHWRTPMYLSIYVYSESWDIITVIKAGKQLAMATHLELGMCIDLLS